MTQVALDTTKPADFHLDTNGPKPPAEADMRTVKLLKSYRPRELPDPQNKGEFLPPVFEIVGYMQEAILKKNAAGQMETVRPETFIDGEQPPPASPGTGFDTKLWAGAVIKVAADEARAMKKAGIAEYEYAD